MRKLSELGYPAGDTMEVAFLALEAIERFCPLTEISGVKACVVTGNSLMVEWIWKGETDVAAVFCVDERPLLSVAILYRTGRAQIDGRLWGKTELAWMVTRIEHLRPLFLALHRAFPFAKSNSGSMNARVSQYRHC